MLGLKTMQDLIQKLIDGNNLTFEESKIAMNHIMEGTSTEAQFGAFVTSLRISLCQKMVRQLSLHFLVLLLL